MSVSTGSGSSRADTAGRSRGTTSSADAPAAPVAPVSGAPPAGAGSGAGPARSGSALPASALPASALPASTPPASTPPSSPPPASPLSEAQAPRATPASGRRRGVPRIVGSRASGFERRRGTLIVGGLAGLMIVLLTLFGIALENTQTHSRSDIASTLVDRTQQTAGLAAAFFSAATSGATQSNNARQFGAATVTDAKLREVAGQNRAPYMALLDAEGNVLASSPGFAAVRKYVASHPSWVRGALAGAPYTLSDIIPGRNFIPSTIAVAESLPTTHGRRVVVQGLPGAEFAAFFDGFFQNIPVPASRITYIVDGNGHVIATADPRVAVGSLLGPASLRAGLAMGRRGSYGDGGYFASARMPGTTWKTVVTEPERAVFATMGNQWVPWALFAAFGLTALLSLVLLRRQLATADDLSAANTRLTDANVSLESTNALLTRTAELARSNAELEQFASIASHDLQEPLRKVQTFAAQLTTREAERLTPEGKDYLRRMTDAAGRMRTLIDDLLMFSRVTTSARPFVPVDLGLVARQVIDDLEVTIDETGATVTAQSLPTIEADPLQMRQLLQNLVTNALKFRSEGVAPVVTLVGRVRGPVAEITVTDNGIGFEPQYNTRIFRAFERLHGMGAYPGTGIGLALCRKIVERHLGTITAQGRPGRGATFTVTLPCKQPQGSPAPPPQPVRAEDGARTSD